MYVHTLLNVWGTLFYSLAHLRFTKFLLIMCYINVENTKRTSHCEVLVIIFFVKILFYFTKTMMLQKIMYTIFAYKAFF
jgi:hypothetical protein